MAREQEIAALEAANRAALAAARHDRIQKQLDEALAATFPASDPVAIVTSQIEEDWIAPDDASDANASRHE
jgi:hypothetical protein